MKRFFILLLFQSVLNPVLFGQAENNHRSIIKEIKNECEKINNALRTFQNSDEKMFEYIRVNEIEVDKFKSQNHPALGANNSTITFYYYAGTYDVNDGDDLLFKIEHKELVAAHESYYEYYFNSGSQLIFYFEKTSTNEERFYFNNGQLIEYRHYKEKVKSSDLTNAHFSQARLIQEASKKRCWY